MLNIRTGDIFQQDVQAFAHGCNCRGVMGAGIARDVAARYPRMFQEYQRRCLSVPRQFNPGDAWLWQEAGRPAIFNLATQEFYGSRGRASLLWLEASLQAMCVQADSAGITTIALPMIGAGLGGLRVDDVRICLDGILSAWSGNAFLIIR